MTHKTPDRLQAVFAKQRDELINRNQERNQVNASKRVLEAQPSQPEFGREMHSRTPTQFNTDFTEAAEKSPTKLLCALCGSMSANRLALCGQLRISIGDWLIKSERLDVAAQLAQWVEASRGTRAGIGDEIIKAVLACNHHEMRYPASEPDAHDHRISPCEI